MNYLWNRIFARFVDYGTFYLSGILLYLMLPLEFGESFYCLFALAVPFVWPFIEALLVAKKGKTLGQKMFGMKIEDGNESNLSFKAALQRAFFIGKRPGVIKFKSINRWKYLVALFLAIACVCSLFLGEEISNVAVEYEQNITKEGWIQYSSEDERFTVNFPKKPQLDTLSFDVPNSSKSLDLNEVKAKADVEFSVSYVELPRKWRLFSSTTLLKGAMNVILENMPGAKIITKTHMKYKNYPGIDFHMTQDGNEIEGRLILVGSTLYKLTVTRPQEIGHEVHHQEFLDSFDLKTDIS
ncbi:MAG: RDD family protein [Rhabdochlamydiaceae bacterium]|jgi:uncharacterized RDD family membrane protein YckC